MPLGINLAGYDAARRAERRRVPRRLLRARSRRRKGCTCSPTPTRCFRARDAGRADAPRRRRLPGAARTQPYLDDVKRDARRGRPRRRVHLSRRGRSRRQARVPADRSTCCRCRRTYDEPKGVFLLEAMASGVPGRAAAARRVHRDRREDRRRPARRAGRSEALADGLLRAVAGSRAARRRSASAASTASASTTASQRSTDRLLDGLRRDGRIGCDLQAEHAAISRQRSATSAIEPPQAD